jgi:8-oxo-dGTP pyrophosphatase MutT (NUDIX family)
MIVSVGIVPVLRVGHEYKFLLLRVYNYFEPPKGRAEKNENLLDTAIRETFEETSISKDELNFKWGMESYTTESYKKGTKINTFFIAETTKQNITLPINPELGKPEHHGFKWVTYDEAKKLTNERIGKVIDWAYNKIK